LKFEITEGEPKQMILNVAAREGCGLIIMGASGSSDLFGGMTLGSTIEYLVRKSPVSVLVVKTRPHGAYQNLLVGTDFTDESRYGLEVAAGSFPDSRLTLMHAFDLPYRSLLSDSPRIHDFAAEEKDNLRKFLNEAHLAPQVRARINTLIEHGPPSLMMSRYVEEQGADLSVIGAYGRGFLFHLLGAGNTPRIVDLVPSDILLVRAQRPEN
jgi:nucleotide-binding universal stress UspA family protein